jgi:hypothetical protein
MSSNPARASLSREFVPVREQKESLGLLREAEQVQASAILWTKDQEWLCRGRIESANLEALGVRLEGEQDTVPRFIESLKNQASGLVLFSLSLSKANIFFKAEFVSIAEGLLRFHGPQEIFKVQRRKDFRFPIPYGHVLHLEFRNPLDLDTISKRKVIDLSAGGLSFFVPESDAMILSEGATLRSAEFRLSGRKISCDLEVRHLKPYRIPGKPPGVRVGVSFSGMREEQSTWIAAYVLEESRKFLSRWK